MMLLHNTISALRRFLADEKGSVTLEAVLILPLMVWAVVAMMNFWDVFRSYNQFQKAAHTVSNVISRTKKAGNLTTADMQGYYKLMNFLMTSEAQVDLRITAYTYRQSDDKYLANWSCNMGKSYPVKMTDALLAGVKNKLPVMADGDVHILLEASYDYKPLLNFLGAGSTSDLGLIMSSANVKERMLREFISERPRDGSFGFNPADCPVVN